MHKRQQSRPALQLQSSTPSANRSYPIEDDVNGELYDLFRANSLREVELLLLFGMFHVIHLFSALMHFPAIIRGEQKALVLRYRVQDRNPNLWFDTVKAFSET